MENSVAGLPTCPLIAFLLLPMILLPILSADAETVSFHQIATDPTMLAPTLFAPLIPSALKEDADAEKDTLRSITMPELTIADLPNHLLVPTLFVSQIEFVLLTIMEIHDVFALPILSEHLIAADQSVSLMLIVLLLD